MTKTAATRSKEVSQSEQMERGRQRLSSVVGKDCGGFLLRILVDAVDSSYGEVGDDAGNSTIVDPFQRMCMAVNGAAMVVDRGVGPVIDSRVREKTLQGGWRRRT
ncbi:hypothetical protein ONS95_012551 [Cadophora gregata]|uniref:uncharacterized protein n=1 Tax=Cadophora gregata TaxID=51156 RepID=UPI0026DBE003|nr:uncharacterized protein ONS95_012551 [Cadophora gregata]KAK0118250.1 hypothetical protein ONS95_012551 [Cadophora gregata]KAK0123322.1 hypothetical protein ONS96_010317 [Cadophora gregata f. sp. sojae]